MTLFISISRASSIQTNGIGVQLSGATSGGSGVNVVWNTSSTGSNSGLLSSDIDLTGKFNTGDISMGSTVSGALGGMPAQSGGTTVSTSSSDSNAIVYSAVVMRECPDGYIGSSQLTASWRPTINGSNLFYRNCVPCPTYAAYVKNGESGGVVYDQHSPTSTNMRVWPDNGIRPNGVTECAVAANTDPDDAKDASDKNGPYFIDESGLFDFVDDCKYNY